MPFNVGDRVRLVANCLNSQNPVGFVGYVVGFHDSVDRYPCVRESVLDACVPGYFSDELDLELVEQKGEELVKKYQIATFKQVVNSIPAGYKAVVLNRSMGESRLTLPDGRRDWVHMEYLELSESDTFTHPDPVLSSWGITYEDTCNRYQSLQTSDRVIADFLKEQVYHLPEVQATSFHERLVFLEPTKSRLHPGQISIWQTRAKRDADRKTAYKVGRAIKYMFPELTDASLERVVDAYRKNFPDAPLVVKVGGERENFKRAYSHTQSRMENPYTTSARKSISNSCMRGSYDNVGAHPTEVYASGEFKIYWTETGAGTISSRCVVWFPKGRSPQAGPIYGVSEDAIDTIQDELTKINAVGFSQSNWIGAKILKIDGKYGPIGPYIDGERDLDEYDDEYFIIVHEGKGGWEASSTGGYLEARNKTCCNECGEPLDEDDGEVYRNSDGECYCESCFNDRYFTCADDGECYDNDDCVSVYYKHRWRGTSTHSVYEGNLASFGAVWCEHEDEWWKEDCVVTNTYDDEAVSQGYCDKNYTLCELSDLYHPDDYDFGETTCGITATVDALTENGYTMNPEGKWEIKQEEAA